MKRNDILIHRGLVVLSILLILTWFIGTAILHMHYGGSIPRIHEGQEFILLPVVPFSLLIDTTQEFVTYNIYYLAASIFFTGWSAIIIGFNAGLFRMLRQSPVSPKKRK